MPAPAHEAPVILVADDSPANCDLLAEQLRSLGYRPIVAFDGPSALEVALSQKPQLIILDVNMPSGDLEVDDRATGFEVCRRLKRDPRTARTPVVFVTALHDSADRVKGIEAGGDDFLTKPHNRLVLGARVSSLLKLKAATDAMEESFRRLRDLERVRDELMTMIVHDLKTPLTGISAVLELMEGGDLGPVNERQVHALRDAQHQSNELLRLIDDLLEVRRIEETSLTLSLERVEVPHLVEEALRDWQVRFGQERTIVRTAINSDTPTIIADRGMLKRVLGNLIQNALVHSAYPITLEIAVRTEAVGSVRLSVSDNGPGIPPQFHDVIFRKFEQVQSGITPRVRTSGLGLTFCRLVVDAHGGRIWVESEEGKGSTFHVALPVSTPVSRLPGAVVAAR